MTLIDCKPAWVRGKLSFRCLDHFYLGVASLDGSSWFTLVLSESGNKFLQFLAHSTLHGVPFGCAFRDLAQDYLSMRWDP